MRESSSSLRDIKLLKCTSEFYLHYAENYSIKIYYNALTVAQTLNYNKHLGTFMIDGHKGQHTIRFIQIYWEPLLVEHLW